MSPADPSTGRQPPARRVANPFRNEADAFRVLLVVGAAVLAVGLLAKLNAVVGVIAALVLAVLAARITVRWFREALAARERGESGPFGEPRR